MELWDIYDIDRNKTGRTMARGEAFKEGDYHMVVQVCIFNKKGEMLIQQRQSFKDGWPGRWDLTAGGCANKGDDSRSAMHRELLEEMGIDIDFTHIRPVITTNPAHTFHDMYILEREIDLADLKFQYEEVQDAKWATKEEILQMIADERFVPHRRAWIEYLFDQHEKMRH